MKKDFELMNFFPEGEDIFKPEKTTPAGLPSTTPYPGWPVVGPGQYVTQYWDKIS